MRKLVALVALEIVAMTSLGVWMASSAGHDARPHAFTALSYAVQSSFQ